MRAIYAEKESEQETHCPAGFSKRGFIQTSIQINIFVDLQLKNLSSLAAYYRVLGLSSRATETEVRSAFRKLALQWHPDRNSDPQAADRFVEINEAYEAIVSAIQTSKSALPGPATITPDKVSRENAKERGRQFARARYEEYINSEQFQLDVTHESINHFLGFILSIAFLIALPAIIFNLYGTEAIPVFIALLLISGMLWIPGLFNIRKVDFSRLKGGWLQYYMESLLAEVLILIISLSWLVLMCLRIFLTPNSMLIIFGACIAVWWSVISFRRMRPANKSFMAITLGALTFSAFILTNNLFGSNLRAESYPFEVNYYVAKKGHNGNNDMEESPLLILPDNQYEAYPTIRFYLNPSDVKIKQVTFIIGTGLFGIDYLSERQLQEDSLPY